MKKSLSIDIGGTKISYATVNENGDFETEIKKIPTPKTAEAIFDILSGLAKELSYDALAIATAGAVNIDNTGVISSTPNLPEGYSRIDFSKLTRKKVFVENDANAAAWAEFKLGAAKGSNNALIITLGTGIGGGAIVNGKLLRGKSGAAMEAGSMKIFADRREKCTCNRYDCWESYASGTGLKNCAIKMSKCLPEFKTSFLNDKKNGDLTTYDVIEGLKNEDLFCKKVFAQWEDYLYIGLVGLVNIFDPECVVISGGMGEFIHLEEIEKKINAEIVVPAIKLHLAKMKNNAGIAGAALLALE
jgi:glucokinase